MSVRAVLAHEYYGHRQFRDEYLKDYAIGKKYFTTPYWEDECRASITAAKLTPNLTERDKCDLINDAIYRANEFGHVIENDEFIKGVLYGYSSTEKGISNPFEPIRYISKSSIDGEIANGNSKDNLPKVRKKTRSDYDFER